MMQFTDSHLHLQDYKAKDAQQIIGSLRAAGFVRVVCASSTAESWEQVRAFALAAPDLIVPAFGLHPWYVAAAPSGWLGRLRQLLSEFPNAWIGECGLDRLKAPVWQGQEEAFSAQAALAVELKRPLNIHVLKAFDRLAAFWPQMPEKFMLHSFGGSVEFLRQALKAGAYVSLSAALLKHKNHAEIIREIPDGRLLLESDGPFLSDFGDIPGFARTVAAVRKTDYAALVDRVNANFEEFDGGK